MSILRPLYPTHKQIEDFFDAAKNGREGIIAFLKKPDAEGEKTEGSPGAPSSE